MRWRIATFRGKHASKFPLFFHLLCNRFQFMFQQSRSLALPPRSSSSFHSPIHFSPYVIRDIMVAMVALARHQRHKEKKQRSHCGHQQTDKSQAARGKGSLSLGFGSDTVVLNGIKATGNPLSHLSEREVDSNKTALLKSVFVKRVSSGLHSTG